LLSLNQIVIRKFTLIFSILFVILGFVIYFWAKDLYIDQTKEKLRDDINLISFELKPDTNFDVLAKKIKKDLKLRVTIISKDGVVIAESHKDKELMDNHRHRDEILQADKEEFGYKIRHSKTLNKDLIYVAKKIIQNNETIYIRLSKELKNIDEKILLLGLKMFSILILFFIVLFFSTYKISKQIETEIERIMIFLSSLTKKKKNNYIHSELSTEFYTITKLLTKVSQILTKREKQKAKYTQRLKIANRQKDDIISAISHEFKNPIAVINGYSQTILENKELDQNTRDKFLTKIYTNCTKLTNLIDTLRLSIKLESNKQNISFTEVNLYEIICDNVENLKLSYPSRDVKIIGDKDLKIRVDTVLFGIVLTNLIENAFKYSQDDVIIEFDSFSADIIDRGIGISQKNIKNITDKFYRIHQNSWNNSLGLGLFIVSNILKLHDFTLDIQSTEGKGSTFSIKF